MSLKIKKISIITLVVAIVNLFNLNIHAMTGDDLGISAKAYVLIDAKTGYVIASNNENEQMAMASTTKIMTALITLEQENLEDYFKVDNDAIMVEGSSMGLLPEDEVSLKALAVGMLLASGNDAANAAAVKIGGDVTSFVEMMNDKASLIGMNNTKFQNPSGLYDDEHYSTAYDMAILAREALQNEAFAQICASEKISLEYGNPPYSRTLSNHNKLLGSYDGSIGVKTGFTKKSGRCLVSAAERDGTTLICVTLNAPNDWIDHTLLLDYGFSKAQQIYIGQTSQNIMVDTVGGEKNQISASISQNAQLTLFSQQDQDKITTKTMVEPFLYAPIAYGDVVGKIEYYIEGILVGEEDLLAGENVSCKVVVQEEKSFFKKLYDMFFGEKQIE